MLRASLQRACTAARAASSSACSVSGSSSSLEAAARQLLPAARGGAWARHFSSGDGDEEQREITDPTVLALADQITQLNLLQVSDLTEVLKKKLGIQGGAMMGMPMGMPMMGAAAAPAAAPAAEAPKEEKTEFTLKLEGFDAAAKIKVIKEVRAITGLGLKEAKELVSGGGGRRAVGGGGGGRLGRRGDGCSRCIVFALLDQWRSAWCQQRGILHVQQSAACPGQRAGPLLPSRAASSLIAALLTPPPAAVPCFCPSACRRWRVRHRWSRRALRRRRRRRCRRRWWRVSVEAVTCSCWAAAGVQLMLMPLICCH